jgi:hypothetical protein
MPGFNGTGPQGQGAMTGRGLGPCGSGMRRRCGRGFRSGFGNGLVGYRSQATLTKEEEKKILEADLTELDLEKQEIEIRLKEIK